MDFYVCKGSDSKMQTIAALSLQPTIEKVISTELLFHENLCCFLTIQSHSSAGGWSGVFSHYIYFKPSTFFFIFRLFFICIKNKTLNLKSDAA